MKSYRSITVLAGLVCIIIFSTGCGEKKKPDFAAIQLTCSTDFPKINENVTTYLRVENVGKAGGHGQVAIYVIDRTDGSYLLKVEKNVNLNSGEQTRLEGTWHATHPCSVYVEGKAQANDDANPNNGKIVKTYDIGCMSSPVVFHFSHPYLR
ncbi:MAG: hypothetical protein AB1422_00460 [bacterium]